MDKELRLQIAEVDRQFKAASAALARFRAADTNPDTRDAWEEFLSAFARSIGKTIELGLNWPETKPLAHKLNNSSQTNDPGLVYLRKARNVTEHGLKPSADFQPAFTSIGNGFVVLVGDSKGASFKGNVINGRPMGDFQLDTKDGKPVNVEGNPNNSLAFIPARVILTPIKNSRTRGKNVNPPGSVFGKSIQTGDAEQLAQFALDELTDFFLEIQNRLKTN